MKAVTFTGTGTARVADIPKPNPGECEVLPRCETTRLSGTDLNSYREASGGDRSTRDRAQDRRLWSKEKDGAAARNPYWDVSQLRVPERPLFSLVVFSTEIRPVELLTANMQTYGQG